MIGHYQVRGEVTALQLGQDLAEVHEWLHEHGIRFITSNGGPTVSFGGAQGQQTAHPGDWIVRGVTGEFVVVDDAKFRATYREA